MPYEGLWFLRIDLMPSYVVKKAPAINRKPRQSKQIAPIFSCPNNLQLGAKRTRRQRSQNHTPHTLIHAPKHRPTDLSIRAIGVQFLIIRTLHARLDRIQRVNQQIDRESGESARYPDVGVARIVGVGGHLWSVLIARIAE